MIQANELRTGNWVDVCNCLMEQVVEIYPDSISTLTRNHIVDYMPIPLTPEILEGAGFKNGDKRLSRQMVLAWSFGKEFWVENNDGDTILEIKCEYLHQLQNLYFALTGEELNIEI